jgi:hypothetical protein
MLSKMQKTWLWVFGAMFVVPEALFFTTLNMIQAVHGKSFSELTSWLISYRIFFEHPGYLLTIIVIEGLGILGLLVMNFKINKKYFISLPVAILLLGVLYWLYSIYAFVDVSSHINFF